MHTAKARHSPAPLMLGQVIQGEVERRLERRANQERILHDFIREEELEAFPAVVVAPYLSDGIEALVQCQGLGALRPNMVLLGWPTDPDRAGASAPRCAPSPDEGDEEAFHQRMERWAGDLERVVFVDSIGGMSLES